MCRITMGAGLPKPSSNIIAQELNVFANIYTKMKPVLKIEYDRRHISRLRHDRIIFTIFNKELKHIQADSEIEAYNDFFKIEQLFWQLERFEGSTWRSPEFQTILLNVLKQIEPIHYTEFISFFRGYFSPKLKPDIATFFLSQIEIVLGPILSDGLNLKTIYHKHLNKSYFYTCWVRNRFVIHYLCGIDLRINANIYTFMMNTKIMSGLITHN